MLINVLRFVVFTSVSVVDVTQNKTNMVAVVFRQQTYANLSNRSVILKYEAESLTDHGSHKCIVIVILTY